MAPAHETVIRAVGMALASLSAAFAMYMLAYGAGKTRINGMEHLAIFAQPRGPGGVVRDPPTPPADGRASRRHGRDRFAGRFRRPSRDARAAGRDRRREADRVWLKIDGAIRTAAPGDNVAGLGRIGAIVARNGGWVLLDDKGKELLAVAKGANGASLFTRRKIFE